MRAVFIYSNFDFSKRSAGATRMFYYAQILANKNTNVYLVSCSTSNIATNSFKEIYPNIFILENPNLTQSLIGTLKYIVNLYKFSKKASTYSAFIFYPSPLVYLEIIAIVYLKLIKGCRIFYEFNEVRKYTSAFYEKVSFKKPVYSVKKLIYKSVFSFMEVFLPFYNGLICISTSMVNYGKKFNQNLIRIPILTNPDLEIQYSNVIYNNPNSFNIGFSGTIHPEKENLIEFFEVLSRLKEKKYNFTLNLCGFIDKKHIRSLLEEKAGELKIKNDIKYHGTLNSKELSTFLSQQQLLVIPRGYTKQNHFGFSTKLSDYLNHGKPILVTDVSDNGMFIIDSENGFIVPPNNSKKMLEKLIYIIDNYKNIKSKIVHNAFLTSKNSFYYLNFKKDLKKFIFNS